MLCTTNVIKSDQLFPAMLSPRTVIGKGSYFCWQCTIASSIHFYNVYFIFSQRHIAQTSQKSFELECSVKLLPTIQFITHHSELFNAFYYLKYSLFNVYILSDVINIAYSSSRDIAVEYAISSCMCLLGLRKLDDAYW